MASCRAIIALIAVAFLGISAEEPIRYGDGRQIAALVNPHVRESSGIAVSRISSGAFWTHNDAGGGPQIFAFDREGRDLGTFTVDANCRDWEDIASAKINGACYLAIADIGDNDLEREDYAIYLIEEPTLTSGLQSESKLTATEIRFQYPDGLHNCEALGIDPVTGKFYLVTKVKGGGPCAVYELTTTLADPQAQAPFTAVKLADLAIPTVVAMDISPDGRRAIVLTKSGALEYSRVGDEGWAQAFAGEPRALMVPLGKQSEAICYGADGASLYLTSETGKKEPVPPCPLFEMPAITAPPTE